MNTVSVAALVVSCGVCVPAEAQSPAGISDWARLARLTPGTEIVVESHGLVTSRYFLSANDSELIVLDLTDRRLPRDVKRALMKLAKKRPRYLDPDGRVQVTYGNLRITPAGVFLRDVNVAELWDVFERIARPDVVMVATPPRKRGSALGAVLGATAGFVGGWFFAQLPLRFVYSSNPLWLVGMVALPIAGALLGYEAETGVTQTVIYRASGG